MNRFMDKVIGIMGFTDEDPEDEILEAQEEKEVPFKDDGRNGRKSAQVVSIHTQKQLRVVFMEPTTFEDAQNVADQLKNRRPVIVNLENADHSLAKRIVDFVSGTTYALSGNMQKVGNGIFLFVPNNVDISGEVRDDLKDKGLFWSNEK